MLIPGRAAGEIHLSGVFIYAGHNSHADSCLVLTVGFWSCSSLASAWCHQMVWEGWMVLFPSFSSRRYCWLVFSFELWGTDASSGELCPSHPDVSKGNNHPLSGQAFQHFLLAAFEMTEIEVWIFLVLVPWPKLVRVTWSFLRPEFK